MALPILDGNQSATTLSSILTSGEHIPAHTVVSLGTQAITDMRGAVSGSVVSISNFPATQTVAGTVTANVQPQQSDDTDPNIKFIPIGYATVDGGGQIDQWTAVDQLSPLPVYFPANNPIPAGTNRIGVVTIGAGTVTLGASTAQIGSVTAFLTYSQTAVSLSSTAATAIPIVFPTNGVYGGSLQGYNGTNTYIYSGIQAIGSTSLASATSLPVSLGSALPAGTNRIGVVTIGGGTVTIEAGTAQIGSVTASISGTVPISISSVTIGNSVTIGSLPAISGTVTANGIASNVGEVTPDKAVWIAYNLNNTLEGVSDSTPLPISGTVTANGGDFSAIVGDSMPSKAVAIGFYNGDDAGISQVNDSNRKLPISGTVTASISNSVVTFYPMQGTSVSNTNFTSTTASTTLVSAVAGREVLTVFNEGAGNLHISPGATCTTVAYQVRLSAGDYWECPAGQLSLAHTAVFATAGTARVTQVS